MFRLKNNDGTTSVVRWRYNRINKFSETPDFVECILKIEDGETALITISASATKSPKDNFNRKLGRKLSFVRMLDTMIQNYPEVNNKEFRRSLWEGFHKMQNILHKHKKTNEN